MKTVSKNITLGAVISSLMVMAIASPSMAVVAPINNGQSSSSACTRITNLKTTNGNTATKKVTELEKNFANRLSKMTTDWQSIDQTIIKDRQTKTTQFEAKIQAMKAQTNLTDAQRAAIEAFRSDIINAEIQREQTVDKARVGFKNALRLAVSTQQQEAMQTATEYHQAVLDAFTTALANCDSANAMVTLKASIKTAREIMTQTRERSKLGDTIKQLAQTRTATIKAADDKFKTLADQYAQTLANALK